jgi:hypothetical protein
MICIPLTKYSADQIKNKKTGGVCSTYGGEKKCIQDFGGETRGKDNTWKTLS